MLAACADPVPMPIVVVAVAVAAVLAGAVALAVVARSSRFLDYRDVESLHVVPLVCHPHARPMGYPSSRAWRRAVSEASKSAGAPLLAAATPSPYTLSQWERE